MATIEELEQRGALERVRLRLKRLEFEERRIYLYPEVAVWLRDNVPQMEQFYEENLVPIMQARALFHDFIVGEPFEEERMFWRMRPSEHDIYELKTADLRFFGWFHRPREIVLARSDTFERVHKFQGLASGYRDEVRRLRDDIELDEPKYPVGADPEDVF